MLEGISLIVAEKDQSKDLIKLVHPMVKEGVDENPFVLDQSKYDKEEDNLDNKEQVRIKKKENWLKPVKAAKIPSTYQYK